MEAECLHLNRLIGSLHGKAQGGGKHEDSDYKVLKRKQWEARGRIFFLQGAVCAGMPAGCEPELIDMRYPCQAVAAPTAALLTAQDHLGRDMERNVQAVADYEVSKHILTGANQSTEFSVTNLDCRRAKIPIIAQTNPVDCLQTATAELEREVWPRNLKRLANLKGPL